MPQDLFLVDVANGAENQGEVIKDNFDDIRRILREHRHEGGESDQINLFDIFGSLETISAVPTNTPTNIYEQNKLYISGLKRRLYVRDVLNGAWRTIPFIHYFQLKVFDFGTNVATGDGKYYIHIPASLDSLDLVEVHAKVITAGVTGTTDIQIANVTDAVDMLSTKLTIDSGETGSDTAAAAAVIDTTKDDVAVNDQLRIDVDAVQSGTAPKGLIITLGFA